MRIIIYTPILEFEWDDQVYQFIAGDERERDSWISSLHIASFQCIHMQLLSLQDQLHQIEGRKRSFKNTSIGNIIVNLLHGI